VSGNLENVERPPQQGLSCSLSDQEIGWYRFHHEVDPVFSQQIPVRKHRFGHRMHGHGASVAPGDGGGVQHMVEVAVRQEKQGDFFALKRLVRPLRSVDEQAPAGAFDQISVGLVGPASEHFGESWCQTAIHFIRFAFFGPLCNINGLNEQ
jgi:hypothetical protein